MSLRFATLDPANNKDKQQFLGRFKLSKKEHLLKRQQFKHIFNNGNRLKHKQLLILFMKNQLGVTRVGFIVPQKNIKLATTRNRTKRLLREAYRLNKNKTKQGFDIVLYANRPVYIYSEAEKVLLYLLNKAGISKA